MRRLPLPISRFMSDPTFFLVAALAVFLVGLSKSGLVASLGVVGVPLLTLVIPARDAAGMMLPLLIVMDMIALIAYRREVNWRIFWILLPGALVGTVIAFSLSAVVSEAMVRLAIGIITLLFVLDAWLPLRKKLEGLPPSRFWGTFWGSVAGFTSFVSHTGGPPVQIYMLPLRLTPALFAGTNAVFFAVVNAVKIPPYLVLGQLSWANMQAALYLVPVAIAGMLVGVFVVRRIDPAIFYRVAYLLIFLLSLKLIYDGAVGLLA
ncbi:sulfite exporter TauE/SafE family protein [Pelagibacterium sp. 26DY04]|uniref:sulfite exporter TauE/SafE family protein n=1 Tax=Pelagibacterium sp. 26DY04 TaxID=2967130 RepID=UPI002814A375|nr:sulfite exporter TauE/SafE family protein [Pelagibacterium sp. 26DY04]WMT86330.1 sulfite exporter TauE/SafE family protein [Pelagibacterium sp. 26DY04]